MTDVCAHSLAMVSRRPLDHLPANMTAWEARKSDQQDLGRRNWLADEPGWGVFHTPESIVNLFPADLDGLDVIELGCGTAYVSVCRPPSGR